MFDPIVAGIVENTPDPIANGPSLFKSRISKKIRRGMGNFVKIWQPPAHQIVAWIKLGPKSNVSHTLHQAFARNA
ncbi:hypothetical protein [uncultured Shimia sp.]|uniref:hypothetical protein n=1 Tax=uncultured Shimia sp. TaxID=573152 RepID=UPI0025CFE8D2|nr:hypothetical protein [uncultured Shimia sp.]